MRKFVLFIFLFCLMMPVQVFAMEPSQEETIVEVVDEMVDEVTDTEVPEDYMEEIDSKLLLLEKLDAINQNLFIIEITLLFMVGSHYVEKWLKTALSSIKDSGRVM